MAPSLQTGCKLLEHLQYTIAIMISLDVYGCMITRLQFFFLYNYAVTKTTMDSSQPNPPIRILQIVYHWLSTYPNLLSPHPLLNKEISELPLVHSNSINFDSEFPKPVLQCLLPGLMQWCVFWHLFVQTIRLSLRRPNLDPITAKTQEMNLWIPQVQSHWTIKTCK